MYKPWNETVIFDVSEPTRPKFANSDFAVCSTTASHSGFEKRTRAASKARTVCSSVLIPSRFFKVWMIFDDAGNPRTSHSSWILSSRQGLAKDGIGDATACVPPKLG